MMATDDNTTTDAMSPAVSGSKQAIVTLPSLLLLTTGAVKHHRANLRLQMVQG